MTNINELIQSGANLKIELSVEDLRNFGQEIAAKSVEGLEEHLKNQSESQYLTGTRVCELLDISRVTLWQWDKKGITNPVRMGNLKRYRRSDIDSIGEHKSI